MIDFKRFVENGSVQLDETLIIPNKGKTSGQVVLMVGGGGSGKGYSIKNFMKAETYKVYDVDELKKRIIKLDSVRAKYPEVDTLDFKNPADVGKLHGIVKAEKLDQRYIDFLLNMAKNASELPNLLFDKTGRSVGELEKVTSKLVNIGYDPKNIHIIWVLTNYAVAVEQNAGRDRVVPAEIMLQTHTGAAQTMLGVINNELPDNVNGEVYVILGGIDNTSFILTNPDDKDSKKIKTKSNVKLDSTFFTGGKKKPMAVMKKKGGFKYLKIKDVGKAVITKTDLQKKIRKWVKDNVPKSKDLGDAFRDK